jgi:hypothetical protein
MKWEGPFKESHISRKTMKKQLLNTLAKLKTSVSTSCAPVKKKEVRISDS